MTLNWFVCGAHIKTVPDRAALLAILDAHGSGPLGDRATYIRSLDDLGVAYELVRHPSGCEAGQYAVWWIDISEDNAAIAVMAFGEWPVRGDVLP